MKSKTVKTAAIIGMLLLVEQSFAFSPTSSAWAKCKSISLHLKVLTLQNRENLCTPDIQNARIYIEDAATFFEKDSPKEATDAINSGVEELVALSLKEHCSKFVPHITNDIAELQKIVTEMTA